MKKTWSTCIFYCPVCGHSAWKDERLSEGDDACGRTLAVISFETWRELARQADLKLTDAGRRALEAEEK